MTANTDFDVVGRRGDTVFLVIPKSDRAKEWVEEHIDESATWFGTGFAVEHRYIDPILEGIEMDGLTVQDAEQREEEP